jgi:hypothetical protein
MIKGRRKLAGPVKTAFDFDDHVPVSEVTLFWAVTGGIERRVSENSRDSMFACVRYWREVLTVEGS